MSDKSKSEKAESGRKQRLAAALRANLKRRKAQAKEKARKEDSNPAEEQKR